MIELFLCSELTAAKNKTFSWNAVANYQTVVRGVASATLDGKIYSFGGTRPDAGGEAYADYTYSKAFTIYDIAADTYTTTLGTPPGRTGAVATTVGTKFYVFGGSTIAAYDSVLWEYDTISTTWTSRPAITGNMLYQFITSINGLVYAMVYNNTSFRSELYRFNPAAPTAAWVKLKEIPVARYVIATMTAVPGAIYAFGGAISGVDSNSAWYYNIADDTWTQLNPLPKAMGVNTPKACNVRGVAFLINTINATTLEIYKFNGTNVVIQTQLAPVPKGVVDYGLAVDDNRLHLIGGFSSIAPAGSVNQHEYYVTG